MLLLGCSFDCATVGTGGGEAPAVKAYDAYVKASLVPFVNSCDDLKGLQDTGSLIKKAFDDMRAIVVLASRSKAPANVAQELAPYLAPIQETVKKISSLRVDRDFDRHMKAISEMLACLSWILMKPPQQLPGPFVKEALGSAEFWTNRIRKDFKGKDDSQITFCDNLKTVLTGLVTYIEDNHKAGLVWNPKGVSIAEAAIRLTDEASSTPKDPIMDTSARKRHPTLKGGPAVGNVGGLIAELGQRKNADGSSAATGLRKVCRSVVSSGILHHDTVFGVLQSVHVLTILRFTILFICSMTTGYQRSTDMAQGIQKAR